MTLQRALSNMLRHGHYNVGDDKVKTEVLCKRKLENLMLFIHVKGYTIVSELDHMYGDTA